jgi:hypothetical protein
VLHAVSAALRMDDEIIPDPTIIMVKSEPLEQESENHTDPFVAMVITVHLESFFIQQFYIRL